MTATPAAPPAHPHRTYRYYDLVMAAFVTVLLSRERHRRGKVAEIGGFTFGAGVLFFPISYLFGDVLTEVYGYARARRVVWAGFGALAFASFMSWAILRLPARARLADQAAYETVFGATPAHRRRPPSSPTSAGEFCNSYVLAKMKVRTAGASSGAAPSAPRSSARRWTARSSTRWPSGDLGAARLVLRSSRSTTRSRCCGRRSTPRSPTAIVGFLKRAESEDYYDRDTDFTPFSLAEVAQLTPRKGLFRASGAV